MKKLSLKNYLSIIYISLIALGALFLIDMVVFLPLYFSSNNEMYLLVGTLIGFTLMAAICVGIIISGNILYSIFYKGLFFTSKDNLDSFINHKKNYVRYDNKYGINEFEELNEKLDQLEVSMENATTNSTYSDYTHIGLNFLDSFYTVVEYDSLISNIKNLVLITKEYRNAFIDVTFESDEDNILEQEQENIIRSLKNHFKYNKVLIGKRNNGKKYIVFIPCIDSISRLKEEVELLSKNIAVSNRGTEGLSVINGKISVIIYPYSDIDEIVSDLAYANRQGKSINFYLPNKLFLRKNEGISDISLNVNNVGKLLSMISTLKNSPSVEQDKKIIGDALTHLIGYLNIDEAGLVLYKRDVDRYLVEVNASLDDRQTFGINKPVSFTFINSLENIIDEDGTYYFSNRNHTNSSISKFFDVYGIRGGYFYRLSIDNNTYGMIYFINRNNSLILNSYIKEAILVICTFIDHFQQNRNYLSEVKHMNQRINDISKLSNLRLYTIDKNTFELVAFSETMKDRNINIEIGKKCHKCLYDRDTPCKDCPFITGKKKTYVENSILYETSMVLNKSDGNDIDFLISLPKDSLSDHNRFDVDYLTNSYYSFIDRIKALYLSRSKGYILTLTIDNYMDLNLKHGSEGYAFYVRKFVDKVVNSVKNVNRIYTFHDNVFIIVLPEMGRVDVVDAVEAMYNISKDTYQEENEERSVLNISYEAIKYPQTFDNERDLMQHIDRYLITKDIYKTDSLHFEENDYIRPASRKEFILTTIENAVTNNTFIIRMQPIVKTSDKNINGAEILIRLNDENRNLLFNTFEMIKVAGENNKIGLISDLLLNFIGDTYNKYGYTFFKSYGFNRLSLNTDYSYFSDPQFLDKIEKMKRKYLFPKDFLGFEITERELYSYYDKFKEYGKALLSNGVALICDQYTGEYLDLDRLKSLGISEIKIGRSKVNNIDINADQLKEVLSLIEYADKVDIRVTLVGVENKDQYNLIKEVYKDVYMQGYYFYEPLDSAELIESLRKNN